MRMGDVARFARARPRTQQVGVIAGAALLASAPFGGWSAAVEPGPEAWTPDESFEVGPFEVTIDRAVTVADLGPTIRPTNEGNRLLAVVAKIENVSERMAFLTLLKDAFRPRDADIVDTDPDIYIIKDTSEPTLLNPHVSIRAVVVWEQEPPVRDGQVRLDVLDYEFMEESALTLDGNYWRLGDEVALSGEVAVGPVGGDE